MRNRHQPLFLTIVHARGRWWRRAVAVLTVLAIGAVLVWWLAGQSSP